MTWIKFHSESRGSSRVGGQHSPTPLVSHFQWQANRNRSGCVCPAVSSHWDRGEPLWILTAPTLRATASKSQNHPLFTPPLPRPQGMSSLHKLVQRWRTLGCEDRVRDPQEVHSHFLLSDLLRPAFLFGDFSLVKTSCFDESRLQL